MPTYPLPTLAAQVTPTGISAPSYPDILASLKASIRTIYGSDVYLESDSQDGQMLAIFAAAINDANQTAVAVYNAFSPASAQGAGLSSVVKINGLQRLIPSASQVDLTITGTVGTVINNGVVSDGTNQWVLPSVVTIPLSGAVVVTATCSTPGAITAGAGTVNQIVTPSLGWQTVTNVAPAVPGAPVESDAALRRRQNLSTSLPALSMLASIAASVANVTGVGRLAAYENDTGLVDGNGLPAHSISMVVEGGNVNDVAAAIAFKKPPGTGTFGTTSVVVQDSLGVPRTIHFYALSVVQLDVTVNVTALAGFVTSTGPKIAAALAAFVSGLGIGQSSYIGRLWGPADLQGTAAQVANDLDQTQLDALSKTYKVTSITQARHGNAQSAADVAILFNEAAALIVANITVVIT
jgi:uncharacterized phage protein gp47/JayE